MVYRTDGSSHRDGVANEQSTIDFINTKSTSIRSALCHPDHTLVQVGGTRTKIDAHVVDLDGNSVKELAISIKKHSGRNGTFDWVNTTQHTDEIRTALQEFKKAGKADRTTYNSLFAAHLRAIDDATIRSLLGKCARDNPPWLVINNVSARQYILAKTPDLSPLTDWTYFLRHGRGVTSAQIWRRRGTEEVNTNLRLRLVSNNGLYALFDRKGSVPCFKIQQEQVNKFIELLEDAVRETVT